MRLPPPLSALLREARAAHRPFEPVDWHKYEALKARLKTIFEPGSQRYDEALRQLLDALEVGE